METTSTTLDKLLEKRRTGTLSNGDIDTLINEFMTLQIATSKVFTDVIEDLRKKIYMLECERRYGKC